MGGITPSQYRRGLPDRKGPSIVNNRGDVLALASALSTGEEVTLGPTDMATCAAALKFYANEHRKADALRMMKIPALIAAGLIGTMAVGGSSIGNTEVSMMELPVQHFEHYVRRTIKPLPHISPESLAAQRFAATFPQDG
ncbi:hypothetical protein IVB46_00915 [Bradyrhizobium sp. 61]|uniref:hypothetical protein n=1 Tax=unclassified Bradyrhizobium TaxID=2631580 RepID=UPI001FF70C5A|nr:MULTISPECIES: hypothetical protein [unclassified Bradyrhizobium]MCK1273804.1 hypothetical protein [Bradyrhizobium sp. 61]MCK1448004.1 hypothetical protein [Bradyrhizobium sp. 48]